MKLLEDIDKVSIKARTANMNYMILHIKVGKTFWVNDVSHSTFLCLVDGVKIMKLFSDDNYLF